MSTERQDAPVPFGYKCLWLAIRSDSTDEVVSALGILNARPCSWSEGVAAAYEDQILVTPPVRGWVLAAGIKLPNTGEDKFPDRMSPVLLELGTRFPDVQCFGTHRVVEYHAWARVVNGQFVRRFSVVGDQGIVPWNDGSPTPEERQLGIAWSPEEIGEGASPTEEDVMALAGLWSVNPTELDEEDVPSTPCIVGTYPQPDEPRTGTKSGCLGSAVLLATIAVGALASVR